MGSTRQTQDGSVGLADVIVVGGGVAGLSCARELRARGNDVRVLEKSCGVGGRCATRRIAGMPVDHGLAFYHGDDPDFLSELRSVDSEAPFPWPRRIFGNGSPCQPRAFRANQERMAYANGVSAFPKHLARGIAVDLETCLTSIQVDGDQLAAMTESGQLYRAPSVVLALPAGQVPRLLRAVDPAESKDLAAAIELLAGVSMVRCLTVVAGYSPDVPLPKWDVCYPEESDILQLVSQDSAKRPMPDHPVFVFQGRPSWSVRHWDESEAAWTGALLASASSFCGDWVRRPAWIDTQRWRYARLSGGDSLTAPLMVRLRNGSRVGIAGEAMNEGGGVQSAWLSGRKMAHRLLGESSE